MLILDGLAQRYGCLPSVAIRTADTLDLFVLDVARSWENFQREQAEAKQNGKPQGHDIPVNTLQEMVERVKNGSKKDKR